MIEWAMGDNTLRVTDADNTELSVHGETLVVDGPGPDIPRPVDETVVVTTDELRFPHAVTYACSLSTTAQHELDPDGTPLSLVPDEYVVDIDAEIKTYLRFSGSATISKAGGYEETVVTFPERTRVIVGFRSRHELPTETITVPDSPTELATAISHLATAHKTDSPDRTYPTLRGHPPLLERGDHLEIPDTVREKRIDTGIELLVPADYETLYVIAPLAYYLQATIVPFDARGIESNEPTLRSTNGPIETQLSSMPKLERDVEQLLRKTFFLDCLVRNVGPHGTDLAELNVLDALGVDAQRLYTAPPRERLAAYLDVPYGAIEHRLPDWHLSTYVAPAYDTVEALPFLLDRMSMIYMPQTSKLEGKELVERSLEDFYRAGRSLENADTRGAMNGAVASVDIVKPDLKTGRVHGWLADGVPIDVFNTTPEAYHNRLEYIEGPSSTTSICIVLNDPEMACEHDDVANIYRQRSSELSMDVTVLESLTSSELARVFEADHDFVHYIGHCETDGLRCTDGSFSTSNVDESNAQTFFLNACGSYYEGVDLIENGSVAGAVTFQEVLNEHAVKVGSMFAKLLVHGFSFERALRLARRRIMMGKDYAVVGDGTHSLVHGENQLPITITLEELDGEPSRYFVTFDCYSTRATGSYYYPHTEENEFAYLSGTQSNMTLTSSEVATVLKETDASVIYDGDVYWSNDIWSHFVQ
ncbi:hypothetical protein SAMN04487967_0140 [Natronorubrum sediminis]|uniref:CHAT domain-containing protein n=1 Tax=Natronorubrum sediminis TaxID=640943 RepID=A0A1H6FMH3_9EURY|nr:hypothetical protein [Natronorubrum sediminis]SEH10984.1 hypothetical protein SAMN04487967_0140 [Natronorubrum sediminis]